MNGFEREIILEGSFNFRDLGGYQTLEGYSVKRGQLFRSGNLSKLTESDLEIISQLGIKNICDLRREDEIGRHPDPTLAGAVWNHVPVNSDRKVVSQVGDLGENGPDFSKPGELLIFLNRKMAGYSGTYRRIFDILLTEPQAPMLFHCMAGKDRTGVVATLILSALGVSREVIEEDYLYTNTTLDRMKTHFAGLQSNNNHKQVDQAVIDAMFEARLDYLHAFFDEVEKGFGSMNSYLTEAIGLADRDFHQLKSHLLE
jgi:protein-tyrosine phosphatase